MAKKSAADWSEDPADSAAHAKPFLVGSDDSRGDITAIPGVGVKISKLRAQAFASRYRDTQPPEKRWAEDQLLISENEILEWAQNILAWRQMQPAPAAPKQDEEFDTVAGCEAVGAKSNEFWSDRSRSSILVSTAQSTGRWLNASAVKHQRFVIFQFTTPDGARYGELAMTFEQLASALASNSPTPCTWLDYYSHDDRTVLLQEVVKLPQNISERMQQRLRDRLAELTERLQTVEESLRGRAETGKAMGKKALEELAKDVRIVKEHLVDNIGFVQTQAVEEITSVVEQAAASISFDRLGRSDSSNVVGLVTHELQDGLALLEGK